MAAMPGASSAATLFHQHKSQPDADQRAHQRRLARTARADDAEAVAGVERKRHVLDDDLLITEWHDADGLDRQLLRRALQQRLPILPAARIS